MHRRTWLALVLSVALVASALPASAIAQAAGQAETQTDLQATGPENATLRIAVIDGARVLEESAIGRDAQTRVQELRTRLESEIQTKQEEVDALVRQRQEQALTLNDEAMARLQEQIEQGQVDLQRMREDANRQLQRAIQQAQEEINAQLVPAVEQLAQQEGYDLIIDANNAPGLLYFSNTINVTDQFIQMVNAGSGLQQR